MIKLEDIEILGVKYRTLDNGASGVYVAWTPTELKTNSEFGLYSLSRDKYDELCRDDELFNWCKQAIYQNEIQKVDMKTIAKTHGYVFIIRCPKCNSQKFKRTYNYQIMSCAKCGYMAGGLEFVEDVKEKENE